MRWDIFCRVIDNLGDIGVCWRLSAELAARGDTVRLWIDAPEPLVWMAPGALEGRWPGVQVLHWTEPLPACLLQSLPPYDVWVEGFGCEIAPEFIASLIDKTRTSDLNEAQTPVWLNLDYLSAEPWVERMHALPSPVQQGPAAGRIKWFFYPGFTAATGGLLHEQDLPARQAAFSRGAWLAQHGQVGSQARTVSLFCYEPAALTPLLRHWTEPGGVPVHLLITHGRTAEHARQALGQSGLPSSPGQRRPLSTTYLPLLPQTGYDELLWACELNLVRGEDSLTRALWAGQPFVWQLYPQEDRAHHAKLEAFLDWLQAPATLRRFHRQWNGMEPPTTETLAAASDPAALAEWRACAQAARQRLIALAAAHGDLAARLSRFVSEKR